MLRTRANSELLALEDEKGPTSPSTNVDVTKPSREGDIAQTPLARWRRAEENRFKAVQNKHDAEQSAQDAENLRRYEIERARRARDFGVGGLPPASDAESWKKFDAKHGRKTPPPSKDTSSFGKGKAAKNELEGRVGKSDAWTIHKGRGETGPRPAWETAWHALGQGSERMKSPTVGSEEDAILPTSPSTAGTTLRGSESVSVRRGSGSGRWI